MFYITKDFGLYSHRTKSFLFCIFIAKPKTAPHKSYDLQKAVQIMRNAGLEPARPAAQEPKSCMSANSISSAYAILPA